MKASREFRRQRRMNRAGAVHAALAGERGGDHGYGEVRLPTLSRPRVAGVAGAFVRHLQQCRGERLGKSAGDAVGARFHALDVGMSGARENPLCKTRRRPHISGR